MTKKKKKKSGSLEKTNKIYKPLAWTRQEIIKIRTEINEIAKCWWLTAIILATQEAEMTRITVQSQP
jgi:hypothetical protein